VDFDYDDLDLPRMANHGLSLLFKMARKYTCNNIVIILAVSCTWKTQFYRTTHCSFLCEQIDFDSSRHTVDFSEHRNTNKNCDYLTVHRNQLTKSVWLEHACVFLQSCSAFNSNFTIRIENMMDGSFEVKCKVCSPSKAEVQKFGRAAWRHGPCIAGAALLAVLAS
jgi:hypothetical protein